MPLTQFATEVADGERGVKIDPSLVAGPRGGAGGRGSSLTTLYRNCRVIGVLTVVPVLTVTLLASSWIIALVKKPKRSSRKK